MTDSLAEDTFRIAVPIPNVWPSLAINDAIVSRTCQCCLNKASFSCFNIDTDRVMALLKLRLRI